MWLQRSITIEPKKRGFHLITEDIRLGLPEMKQIRAGLLHVFLQHTSASLTINENADASVRRDMDSWFARSVPDGSDYFEHTLEGPDDMTAHIKSSLLGVSLTIPVCNGDMALGVWQGIYLGEHREHAGARRVLLTLNGQT